MLDAHRVTLCVPDDFEGWRDAARDLAEAGIPAGAVVWQVEGGDTDLFGSDAQAPAAPSFPVPREFVNLARNVVCHSDPERFALLYAMLLRLRSNKRALDDEADRLVRRLHDLAKAVRRDIVVGQTTDAGVSVKSGLAGTERVVMAAAAFLTPGQKVKPVVQKMGG